MDPEPLHRPSQDDLDDAHREALEQLLPHTLPADAPGAWARRRLEGELARMNEARAAAEDAARRAGYRLEAL